MRSGFFRIWTFPILRNGNPFAMITKKWAGVLQEAFLDADNFIIEFQDPSMTVNAKRVLLSAAIFIDLEYFEQKAKSVFND
jgi:hypothetical protein